MSDIVIKVENLYKQYRLGEVGTGSMRDDFIRWRCRMMGKEDPFLTVGEENDRTIKSTSKYVWALKDINFEVKQGEILGIIGRNGAGKSTLLKILSRTTGPTKGSLKMKGRIASLLEVGTGFHGDLSGRENIFLNGAIMGMNRAEIKRKLDEIIDFAGVEKYIDTPVKRYSSGMYVRLAFGVAAHLEPDIMVVDEVLAVGDAEFQKKALGKMKEESRKEGRTVLFVSHNMTAMNSICSKAIYLKNGLIHEIGSTSELIKSYLSATSENVTYRKWDLTYAPGDEVAKLLEVRLTDENNEKVDLIDFYKGGNIEYTYQILKEGFNPIPNIHLLTQDGQYILVSTANANESFRNIGKYTTKAELPPHFLNDGKYVAGIAISTLLPHIVHFFEEEALKFEVLENMEYRNTDYRGEMPGTIRPVLKWATTKIN